MFEKDYNGEIVEFGESVHHKSPLSTVGKADDRWNLGVWLGKSMRADEHLVGASKGVLTCRSIWRRPEQQRWNKQLLDAFVGSPWEPVPPAARELPEGLGAAAGFLDFSESESELFGLGDAPSCRMAGTRA